MARPAGFDGGIHGSMVHQISSVEEKDVSVSRLTHITSIGVERMGDDADRLNDPQLLRLEDLDTDLRPPQSALEYTKRAVDDDRANSYLA
jgi:hypothetical protein